MVESPSSSFSLPIEEVAGSEARVFEGCLGLGVLRMLAGLVECIT